jgi:hypothetical protein
VICPRQSFPTVGWWRTLNRDASKGLRDAPGSCSSPSTKSLVGDSNLGAGGDSVMADRNAPSRAPMLSPLTGGMDECPPRELMATFTPCSNTQLGPPSTGDNPSVITARVACATCEHAGLFQQTALFRKTPS